MKKRRIKKSLIILIFVFIIIIFLLIITINKFRRKNSSYKYDDLVKIGYNIKDIDIINTNLSQDEIDAIIKNKYVNNLSKIINNKNFKKEYLDQYIKVSLATNLEIDNIIYIVNNSYYEENIDYDDFAIEIIKGIYFIKDNLKS